ncbi:MAG: TonB-dependent receptor, partial [Gammaproteobacteria bacterium]|nr:TonB-dependent receptor [Gammaproteobacteria bacterium]
MKDHENRRRLRHRVSRGEYQPDGSVTDGRLVFQHKNRKEYLNTLNLTAGGDHLFQSGINIDYHLGWTRSTEDTPFDNEIEFEQRGVDFFPDISDPEKIQANPEPGTIDGIYSHTEIDDGTSLVTNTDYVGAINLMFPYGFNGRATGELKVGAKFRLKNKDQDIDEKLWELTDGADDIILGEDIGEPFSFENYSHEGYSFPSRVTSNEDVHEFIDKYHSVLKQDPDATIEEDANEFDITEQTIALYAMTEINLTPDLMLLPGVRFEQTTLTTEGFDFDADAMSLSPVKDDNSYMKFFPMVHIRYRLTPMSNIRAAFTTAMSRPNFFEMA